MLRNLRVKRVFRKGKTDRNHIIMRSAHPRVLFIQSLIIFLISTALLNYSLADDISLDFDLKILAMDTLAIYLSPPVENLSVDCYSAESNNFRVAFFSREFDMGQEFSLIYMMPKSEGIYNLIVSFETMEEWNGTIGVYTDDVEFYQRVGTSTVTSQGYFIVLKRFSVAPEDNQTSEYKFNITLQVYGRSQSGLFFFSFPEPIKMALFTVASVAVGYFNAFFLVDLYFKNRTEGVARSRLVLAALLIAASLFILHQIYIRLI